MFFYLFPLLPAVLAAFSPKNFNSLGESFEGEGSVGETDGFSLGWVF
jgi:hypothetical protein